jgi:acyl carrier protein
MITRENLFETIKRAIVETFELDESIVKLDAKLYEELDLDSIDAIDLIVRLEEDTGKKIQGEEFRHIRSVQDIVNSLYAIMKDDKPKNIVFSG